MSVQLPYILVDEFGTKDSGGLLTGGILKKVQTARSLPVLNYQYGYIEELNETLKQYTQNDRFEALKFPLIWLAQPFFIDRNKSNLYFGDTRNLSIFIIMQTSANYKAQDRMTNVFKPILYPIYLELLNQIRKESTVFDNEYIIEHTLVDRYFWGEQQMYLNDKVDCIEISGMKLKINNKCYPGLG